MPDFSPVLTGTRNHARPEEFLESLQPALDKLAAADGVPPGLRARLVTGVLRQSFRVYEEMQQGDSQAAAAELGRVWQKERRRLKTDDETPLAEVLRYEWAVWGQLATMERQERARLQLRRLTATLNLSQTEMGRWMGVSDESIRRWERGQVRMPESTASRLEALGAQLSSLTQIFLPDRLAEVIRRKAPLFDGETALEWILRGRLAEVIDRYDTALTTA